MPTDQVPTTADPTAEETYEAPAIVERTAVESPLIGAGSPLPISAVFRPADDE